MTGRVRTYEAIVKGHNIPQPGVPESFKVLMKELQALCLDVRVLDSNGEEIELKDDEDDDFGPDFGDEPRYLPDDSEMEAAGFGIEQVESEDDVDDVFDDDDDFDSDGDAFSDEEE